MAENGNRGKRGWLRRGTGKTEPLTRPNLPGVASGPGTGSVARPPVDDPTRAAAFGDPWSADAWSDEGWNDGWNDRTRRASVRPAAEPRSADVDAWLESDQTQFADMTADMARKWKAEVPEAVGSTWDDTGRDADVRSADDTDTTARTSSAWTTEAPVDIVDEAEADVVDAQIPDAVEPPEKADDHLLSAGSLPERAQDAEPHLMDPSAHERADGQLQADRVATPLGSVVPVLSSSGISWGSATIAAEAEPEPPIEASTHKPYDETDEEARIDALLAEAEGSADEDDFDGPTPAIGTAATFGDFHGQIPETPDAPDSLESEDFASFDDHELGETDDLPGLNPTDLTDAPIDTTDSSDADQGTTDRFDAALDATASSDPDPSTNDDATPAPTLYEPIEPASVPTADPSAAVHLGAPIVPAVAALPRPGSTWDDDEIEQQIDHLLAEPSLDTALDEHVDDAFVTDVDRTIERDLVAEFGRDDDESVLPVAYASPAATPIAADPRPTTAYVPQPVSSPAAVASTVAPDVQTTTKPQPAMIPAATGHLVGLFLVSGLGLAAAAVLRLSVIAAGAARRDSSLPRNALSLTDRLGNAASGLGTLHGLLLLSAIVCAVLAAAAGRGRSRRDERLAGWICGAALAAGLAGIAAAGLGIKFVTDNGSSFSQVAGDLADLIGLAVTSLAAVWGGWRASDPNP